ncbi:MAG TPA: type II toxin-antitoxin system PemK/MazF family toxin [Gemmatimonadaceae bacterium]
MIERGDVWWAELEEPRGSAPGFRRPLVVVQINAFNRSRIQTVVCVVLSSNLRLADAPGNVVVAKRDAGLPKDSVANISQIVTVDREVLTERAGKLPPLVRERIDRGLRLVLGL